MVDVVGVGVGFVILGGCGCGCGVVGGAVAVVAGCAVVIAHGVVGVVIVYGFTVAGNGVVWLVLLMSLIMPFVAVSTVRCRYR